MSRILSAKLKMRNRIRISLRLPLGIRDFLIILLLFPFIQQRSMQEFPQWLKMTYEYGAVLSASIVFLLFFYHKESISSSLKRLWGVFIFWIIYVFITLLNSPQDILYTGKRAYVMLAIAIFIDMEISRNTKCILKVLAYFYTLYTLANNILVLLFPEGFYEVKTSLNHKGHLLGDDNAIIYGALPGRILLVLFSIYKYGKITKFAWANIVLCEIVFIRLWAGSAMICFAAFIFLLFYGTNIKKISGRICFIIVAAASLIIFSSVYITSLSSSNIFTFIFSALGKSSTFSNRGYMWINAINLITRKPILGYGGYYQVGRYISRGGFVYPCHTPYLQFLLDGGIILFGLFIIILIIMFNAMEKNKQSDIAQVLIAGMFAILLSYVFEYTQLYHVMILFSVAVNIPHIIESAKIDYPLGVPA